MRIVAEIIKNPLQLFFLLLIFYSVLRLFQRKRASTFIILFAIVFLLINSLTFTSRPFINVLEKQYQPLIELPDSLKNRRINILVLGGGHTSATWLPVTGHLNPISQGRLLEGIRLMRQNHLSTIIFSGYPGKDPVSHAETLMKSALSLGIDSTRIDTISTAHNTKNEALQYTKKYDSHIPLILVTDAIHMPRAIRYFQSFGIQHPIPAPTNYIFKSNSSDWRTFLLVSSQNMVNMERIYHEYIGLIWQWLGGD
ncbi:MAG TPA: ElyC/SanA/YdcF family protein [Salinivirgaceae bacterium]|nr:ElyC/SanA/YdcF family protein [Salinivirgaceae bacterium]